MAKDKKKKKDKIIKDFKLMIESLEKGLEEYREFKAGKMIAAKRAREQIMVAQKLCPDIRKKIQEKKNKRMEKK